MAMTAHVVYSAIDPEACCTLSAKMIGQVIRGQIGFDGLLMSDDLSMKALKGSYADRTRAALSAGCDVVLHCNGAMAEMREVAAAAGPLEGASLARAERALSVLRSPQPFDEAAAVSALEQLAGALA
jgi:beta-N-acetylhexosaminidase